MRMNYDVLENNIIDLLKESQAKVGFDNNPIRLYYPLSSLNHFFKMDADADKMMKILGGFSSEKLGAVEVSVSGERFCFYIPAEGAAYVHENTDSNDFIHELVDIVGSHGTMEDIIKLFRSRSDKIHIESIENGEFETLIYFEQPYPDRYYYCFCDEGVHIIYHRFLPEDYADLGL